MIEQVFYNWGDNAAALHEEDFGGFPIEPGNHILATIAVHPLHRNRTIVELHNVEFNVTSNTTAESRTPLCMKDVEWVVTTPPHRFLGRFGHVEFTDTHAWDIDGCHYIAADGIPLNIKRLEGQILTDVSSVENGSFNITRISPNGL